MTLPTIHSNGTSRSMLIDQLCEATLRLQLAYDAIRQTAPNGRDYYPQGPGALEAATKEHMDRLARVDAVRLELVQMAIEIADDGGPNNLLEGGAL